MTIKEIYPKPVSFIFLDGRKWYDKIPKLSGIGGLFSLRDKSKRYPYFFKLSKDNLIINELILSN